MMRLVRLALRGPISVAVMALLMLVIGTLSFFLTNIDIFPAINLPVVMVVWNSPGMASLDMERRMVFISERAYSTTVNGMAALSVGQAVRDSEPVQPVRSNSDQS
jgi:multidrug efflux pump subunit AcrB